MNVPIHQIPELERPRERCLQYGPGCLSLRECLALILGSGPPGVGCLGIARRILQLPGQGLNAQEEERAFFTGIEIESDTYLKQIAGLGPAGRARILAAFELGRRYSQYRHCRRNTNGKHNSYSELMKTALERISMENRANPQEWFGFVPIHRSGDVGELCLVEQGVRTHVNVDPAELFARVLALRPQGLFLFHNHPSGYLQPSHQDISLTQKINQMAGQFGIQLLGHLIVSLEGETWIPPHITDAIAEGGEHLNHET